MSYDILKTLSLLKGVGNDKLLTELRRFVDEGMKKLLSDEEFDATVKQELEIIKQMKGDRIIAMMTVFGLKNEAGEMPRYMFSFADFPEQNKKQEFFKALGLKFMTDNPSVMPVMAILVSEAWTRTLSKEEAEEYKRFGKNVSDYADKKEVVIVSGLTIDGRDQTFILSVKRDKDNNILFDKPSEVQHGENNLLKAFFEGYSMGAVLGDKGGVN